MRKTFHGAQRHWYELEPMGAGVSPYSPFKHVALSFNLSELSYYPMSVVKSAGDAGISVVSGAMKQFDEQRDGDAHRSGRHDQHARGRTVLDDLDLRMQVGVQVIR